MKDLYNFYVYEFRKYGSKEIIQINGQEKLIRFLNKKYWHSLAPFSDKKVSKERDQIYSIGRDDYITNLHYGYDVWRVF